ncbi:MAG: Nif3-like dinuclear metal center hexameric protein [Phycisphaerales bacterium]|nr:Nif3-like dinuclear metal center hexameric protein [Phycisphaerales bacterium]
MPTVSDLCDVMNDVAPLQHAAEWDNTGLLVGRRDADISTVMVCIDLTSAVLREAIDADVQAIVAYHPPLFEPRTRVTGDEPSGELLLGIIESGIAVYSPHTALDAVPGGMADWLIEGVGAGDVRPIECATEQGHAEETLVVTYAPPNALAPLRDAMAAAGAGQIGEYTHCAAASPSTGTFKGGMNTTPAIGESGVLESVEELRLTMACGNAALADVIVALRQTHPYEEAPVHIVPLQSRPIHNTGMGRLIQLANERSTQDIVESYKRHLGVSTLRLAEGCHAPSAHTIIGCCPGAGDSMLQAAESAGATLYITGEMRHHDVLAAVERGTTILLAGHTNTERGYLPYLQASIKESLPTCEVIPSTTDTTPWTNA